MLRLDNTTLQYDINWSMHFIPELTKEGLSENTELTALNAPFIVSFYKLSLAQGTH